MTVPRPVEWTMGIIEPTILAGVQFHKIDKVNIEEENKMAAGTRATVTMQTFPGFLAWAEDFDTSKMSQLKNAPERI